MLIASNKQRGASMMELIMALAVSSVMITLAIPSVSDWADNNRLKATADAMMSGLQKAKMEAVRQNRRARFVLLDTPTFVQGAGGQAGDWEICVADDLGSFVGNRDQFWFGTEVGNPTLVGVSTALLAGQNFATPLAAGAGLTGLGANCVGTDVATTNVNVMFDAMGRAAATNYTSNVTRIDILNARPNNNAKRLVITINPQGQIKMCNPASQDTNQQC